MGLGYVGSFIKEKTSEENTLFIDSGLILYGLAPFIIYIWNYFIKEF